ncbi:hypothetical protein ACFQY7_06735 [Actinomadura luteofluorescens]|uniref:hypothetical protein n=1 Tax=Actinomadura luteofluorescens TaxID=46163 RepID=UPI00362E062A
MTNNNTPTGDCGPFVQVYAENFNGGDVPVGAFRTCAGDGDFRCAGLKTNYAHYYDTLGAYPSGWPDTATSGADGNGGRTFGGYYRPEKAVSVYTASNGDGQMRVHMTSDGSVNSVAAVVPRKCMNLRYGKFTERFIVRTRTPGFKMAHLRYTPNEVDYPEAGGNFSSDPVSVFTHGFAESGADVAPGTAWTSWHTYSTEIVPGSLRFYLDGELVKTVNADFPEAADWVLQNESALAAPTRPPERRWTSTPRGSPATSTWLPRPTDLRPSGKADQNAILERGWRSAFTRPCRESRDRGSRHRNGRPWRGTSRRRVRWECRKRSRAP